jgi:hypothetical protein
MFRDDIAGKEKWVRVKGPTMRGEKPYGRTQPRLASWNMAHSVEYLERCIAKIDLISPTSHRHIVLVNF